MNENRARLERSGASAGLTRRTFLAAAACLPAAAAAAEVVIPPTRRVPFGAASMIEPFRADPRYREALLRHCDVIVPMNDLKWEQLRPERARFDFTDADEQVLFARDNGKALRGHTLLWDRALPPWVQSLTTRAEAERELVTHIETVMARYRGLIGSWDVVNEVIAHDPGGTGPWRDSIWLRLIGPDFVEIAFRAAAAVDPRARLVINDYDFENGDERTRLRRKQLLRIVRRLKERGVPIHGVGLQAHLYADRPIDHDGLARFTAEIHGLGLDVLVTELDVIDQRLPANPVFRDEAAARHVDGFLAAVGANKPPAAVITWGLSDRYSWVHETFPRADSAVARPLPLDESFRPKPMWRVIERFCQA